MADSLQGEDAALISAKSVLVKFLFPLLTAAVFFHICLLFYPFISGRNVILNDYINIPEETLLNGNYVSNHKIMRMVVEGADLSGAAEEFFLKNNYELSHQTQCGWFMHHHLALLSAVNQFAGGRRIGEITQQYGILSTVILSGIMRLTGGVTLDGYLRVLYFFFPFFYFFVFWAALYIFRDFKYVFLVMLLSAVLLLKLSYTSISLAPGFNPIRQLFLPGIMIFLWKSLKNKSFFSFCLAVLFSGLNILNSREFGLFGVLGLAAAWTAWNFLEPPRSGNRKRFFAVMLAIFLLLALFLVFLSQFRSNPLAKYYTAGISGPLVPRRLFIAIGLWISIFYFIILKLLDSPKKLKYLAIFLFVYFQGIFVYFVWNPAPNHFYSIAIPLVFLLVALLKLAMDRTGRKECHKIVVVCLSAAAVFVLLYLPAWRAYSVDLAGYKKTLESHRIYRWGMRKARIYSTMAPAPFVNAVDLIERYASGKRIYPISQYDNLLAFLSDKWSSLPFDEAAISLVTEREVKECVARILEDKPEYIFVDTGLGESIYGISNPSVAYLSGEFDLGPKLKMWEELRKVYLGVINSYELVEKGDIISAYRRKHP